jgi:hypothetical protein
MSKHKDVSNFIALVKNDGLSKASHFDVDIFMPKAFDNEAGRSLFDEFSKLSMLCESTVLPGVMIAQTVYETFGEQRKIPTSRQFNDISLTFICDINLVTRRFFEAWTEYVIDPVTRTMGYYENYTTTMTIGINDGASEAYNNKQGDKKRDSNRRLTMTLYEVYPKQIQDITLSYDEAGFAKVTVDLSYKFHSIAVGE